MGHVFISYVHDNMSDVDRLCQELISRDIQVWRDIQNLYPGERWKKKIREAIQQGRFFIACFSREYNERINTYMNEEIKVAIEVLSLYPTNREWFIPIQLNECEIPDRDIGGGETLRDFQYFKLYQDWDIGIERLQNVIQSESTSGQESTPSEESGTQPSNISGQIELAMDGDSEVIEPSTVESESQHTEETPQPINDQMVIEQINSSVSVDSPPNQRTQDNVRAYINRGRIEMDRGELDNAIEAYTKALELDPNCAVAYSNRGNVYHSIGKFENALEDSNKAIELYPNLVEAYNTRGATFRELGEYSSSFEDFDKAIDLNPSIPEPYVNRGLNYVQIGELNKAIADYNMAISLNPDLAVAYFNRGIYFIKKSEFDRAIQDFSRVIQLEPNSAHAYYRRGSAHRKKDELDKAIADYDKAIELKPDLVEAYNDRGYIYLKKREPDRCLVDLNTAINLKPDHYTAYYNRGNAYLLKRAYNQAIDNYTKAIEIKPDFRMAYLGRREAYIELGEVDLARADTETFQMLEENE